MRVPDPDRARPTDHPTPDDAEHRRPPLAGLVRRRAGPARRVAPDPFLAALGRTLAAARRDRGLTQGALGRALGIDRATISRWEAADRTPTILHLRRFACLIGRPAGRLLDDAEDRLARGDDAGTVRDDGETTHAAAD